MGQDADFNYGRPLGTPALRSWEITSNSTRYDKFLAAPSDGDLVIMWIAYSTMLFIFTVYLVTIFLALVTNKKIRRNSYNLYLIYLMIPDIIFSGFCAINCAWLAANNGYQQHSWVCLFQSFYLVFGVCANSWINGIIAYEVLKMLRISNAGRRCNPPTVRHVTRNAMLVYTGAIFVSLWGVVSLSWLPHETNLQNGIYCMPVEYDQASLIFFWLAFFPFFSAIPLFYCVGATVYAVWFKLLPPSGKQRGLAIYFFRLVFVFVIMWGPLLIVTYAFGGANGNPWVVWIVGLWAHFQGAMSASVSLLKEDIRKAVINFLTCGKVDTSTTIRRRTSQVRIYGESEETQRALASFARSLTWSAIGQPSRNFSYNIQTYSVRRAGIDNLFQDQQQFDIEAPNPLRERRKSTEVSINSLEGQETSLPGEESDIEDPNPPRERIESIEVRINSLPPEETNLHEEQTNGDESLP